MTSEDAAEMVQELDSFVQDELKALSYKWVARHYSISANLAKRILFEYSEGKRDRVSVVYLVSGWTRQEPPSHVHKLVQAEHAQEYRESLAEVTGMHVYSVAPKQSTNPDNLWQVTYQQSQQLLKEVLSGQPSASAEAFRSNSCSAVRFTAPPPPMRPPAGPATGPAATGPTEALDKATMQPPQPEARSPAVAKGATAAGMPATDEATATAVAPDAAGPSKPAGTSPPKATGPSPPKAPAAGGKPPAKGAGAAAKPSNTLANMWGKAAAKPKPAAEPVAAASAVKQEAAAQQPEPAAVDAKDEDEDGDAVHVANGKGRKRRGAQIEDSDEEGPEPQEGGTGHTGGGGVAAGGAAGTAAVPVAKPAVEAKGRKAPAKAKDKATKDDAKGGAKRAKTAAAKQGEEAPQPAPEPAQEEPEPQKAAADVDMDDAVLDALDASAVPEATRPAATIMTGGSGRGRKVIKTYINDDGEEVTEEVYEEGPVPLQPQQQRAVQAPQAAKAAAKPAAKPTAPAKAKGKAPAAGQKSMTSFFAKK